MLNSKRVYYFDVLRVAATVAVIILHICARSWETEEVGSYTWNVLNWIDSAVRWAVPIFVMLSGALFLDPEKEISLTVILKKYLPRIAAAFGFWSVVYGIIDLWNGMPLRDLPLALLKGKYHMWFLFLIAGLYLFVPLLRKVSCSKKNTERFLLLFGAVFILIPRIVNLLTVLGIIVPFSDIVLRAMNINVVSICYFFVFVWGHYLHQYDLSKVFRGGLYAVGLLGFVATAGLTAWHSQMAGVPSGMFYVYMSLNVLAMATGIFVFAKYHPWKGSPRVTALSRYSFGIYLSHVRFIDLFEAVFGNAIFLLLFSLPVFLLALGLSVLLHRIPKWRDYIV